MNLNIHAMTTHFVQALPVFLLTLGFFILLVNGQFRSVLLSACRVITVLLPVYVIVAFVTGIIDGKVRFKKLNPPHLKKKIYLGMALIATSFILAAAVLLINIEDNYFIFMILTVISVLWTVLLGKIGGSLLCCKIPDRNVE